MPHFNDHVMAPHDIKSLIKRIKSQTTDARTRFVRANTAMKGLYEESNDPLIQQQIERIMAHLCAIIDVIDGTARLEVRDD